MTKAIGLRPALLLAIALTVTSTIVGAGALYGYQLYRTRRAVESVRILALAESQAAQIAPLLVEPGGADISRLRAVAFHKDLRLVALLMRDADPVILRGGAGLLERFNRLASPQVGSTASVVIEDKKTPPLPELHYAAVPVKLRGSRQPLATLVCAARSLHGIAASDEEVSVFLCKLGLIGAAGICVGLWWLKRQVLDPLARLAAESQGRAAVDDCEPLPLDRGDEIGTVARALTEMHHQVDALRLEAERIERFADSRVAEEKQKAERELQRAQTKIYTDPLTQLGNRRLLDEQFGGLFHSQRDGGQDLAVVMLDIDNFKTLNDTRGHQAGDDLLRFAGELLRQALRPQDVAIRYGGDEFILILPGVSAKDARGIAERAIRLFSQQARLIDLQTKPSMSAGIASLHQHEPETPEGLLGIADEALYAAKRTGKCRVYIYGEDDKSLAAR